MNTSASHLEKLFKILDVPVVGTKIVTLKIFVFASAQSQDPPDEFIQNYTLLVGDLSFSNFQKVILLAFWVFMPY